MHCSKCLTAPVHSSDLSWFSSGHHCPVLVSLKLLGKLCSGHHLDVPVIQVGPPHLHNEEPDSCLFCQKETITVEPLLLLAMPTLTVRQDNISISSKSRFTWDWSSQRDKGKGEAKGKWEVAARQGRSTSCFKLYLVLGYPVSWTSAQQNMFQIWGQRQSSFRAHLSGHS